MGRSPKWQFCRGHWCCRGSWEGAKSQAVRYCQRNHCDHEKWKDQKHQRWPSSAEPGQFSKQLLQPGYIGRPRCKYGGNQIGHFCLEEPRREYFCISERTINEYWQRHIWSCFPSDIYWIGEENYKEILCRNKQKHICGRRFKQKLLDISKQKLCFL